MAQERIPQAMPNDFYGQEKSCAANMMSNQEKASNATMIVVEQKCCVYPARPSDQKYCDLTTFDLSFVTFHYNQKIILYPSPAQGFASAVESLKKSLSEALVHFYPLAGRLCLDDDGILKVHCDNAGVDFIEASSDVVGVATLMDCDSSSEVMQQLVPYVDNLNVDGFFLPLVGVQVTKLRDGVAVGIAVNHLIVDGYSTWHFIRSWADLCRGSSVIYLPPSHDRAMARNIKVKLNLNPPNGDSNAKGNKTEKRPLKGKTFHFSKEMMEEIKSRANKNREGKPLSSFQSLGAHLWQAVTKARKLAPEDIALFVVLMDCRAKVSPPLPKSYFGNAIQNIKVVTSVGHLLSNDLSFAANMLQQVIDSHGANAIKQKNQEWERNPKLYGFSDPVRNCVVVGSSPRFEVYENDFGWGKPVRVKSGCNNKFDGMVYLYPGQAGRGSVDVEITLLPTTMDLLDSDPQFRLTN